MGDFLDWTPEEARQAHDAIERGIREALPRIADRGQLPPLVQREHDACVAVCAGLARLVGGQVRRALYFGYDDGGHGGHFLRGALKRGRTLDPQRDEPGFPWTISHLDTGLLKNRKVPDEPDGRVHWTCGGSPLWFAFVWWDRSGDKRGNSSSGFYVMGFEPESMEPLSVQRAAEEAFTFACEQWSHVVERQQFKLVLVYPEGSP